MLLTRQWQRGKRSSWKRGRENHACSPFRGRFICSKKEEISTIMSFAVPSDSGGEEKNCSPL